MSRLGQGALARLREATPEGWHEPRPKGFEFEVEEFVPALKEGDPDFGDDDYIQVDFYYGNAQGGFNNVCVPADIVEQVKSAEEMAAREIPSLRDVSKAVSSGLHSLMNDGMEFYETSVSGEDSAPYVEGYGRTDDGLAFGVKVAVLEVWRTDD